MHLHALLAWLHGAVDKILHQRLKLGAGQLHVQVLGADRKYNEERVQ